ncbi:hypothetical protein [Pseudarthrobacter oxydans]|uniref:hypothetical protein n=1 Tax=Pseudarthrobacter oxydans TaxID=1671 RepID=UPI0027D7AAD5|nr:hypothetical protein [Pseudarthrobacter oxydans]
MNVFKNAAQVQAEGTVGVREVIGSEGIGVEFNEEAAATFPFDPKHLPINRRLGGSVHDW